MPAMLLTDLSKIIIPLLTDDLRRPPWKGSSNPLAGHCYVASEVAFYILPGGWRPTFIRHEGSPHWLLRHDNGEILDLTAPQFKTPVPHHLGIGKGFLTKTPSKRAKSVLCKIPAHFCTVYNRFWIGIESKPPSGL